MLETGTPIKIYPKWVGKVKSSNLAFITQDTGNADLKNRMKTVDIWAKRGEYEYNKATRKYDYISDTPKDIAFENTPMSGFKIDKTVARSMTDNKMIQIADPRGFQIQISAANLVHIAMTHTITNGEFRGEFLYGKEGANLYLTWPSNPCNLKEEDAKKAKKKNNAKKVSPDKLVAGDLVMYYGEVLLYLGEHYVTSYVGDSMKTTFKRMAEIVKLQTELDKYKKGAGGLLATHPTVARMIASTEAKIEYLQGARDIKSVHLNAHYCEPRKTKLYVRLREEHMFAKEKMSLYIRDVAYGYEELIYRLKSEEEGKADGSIHNAKSVSVIGQMPKLTKLFHDKLADKGILYEANGRYWLDRITGSQHFDCVISADKLSDWPKLVSDITTVEIDKNKKRKKEWEESQKARCPGPSYQIPPRLLLFTEKEVEDLGEELDTENWIDPKLRGNPNVEITLL